MGSNADLVVKIIGDMQSLHTAFNDVQKEISGLGTGLKNAGKDLSAAGGDLTKGVTVPIAAVGAGIIYTMDKASTFDSEMRRVSTMLPGITEKGFGDIKKQAVDLSKQFGDTTDIISDSMYQALSSGIPQDNIFEFMQTSEKLAIGGATDTTTAVDGLTSVVNSYGSSVMSASRASDIMFEGTLLGKSTIAELSKEMSGVVAFGAPMGITFEDINASLATMTIQGTGTAEATTQLKSMIGELIDPVSNVSAAFESLSGKSFKQYIKEGGNVGGAIKILGENVGKPIKDMDALSKASNKLSDSHSALAKQFKTLTGESFEDFIKKGGTVEGACDRLGIKYTMVTDSVDGFFSRVEAKTGALQLSGQGAKIYADDLDKINKSAGATQVAFDKMNEGAEASKKKMGAAIDALVIKMGDKFLPIFTDTLVPLFTDKIEPALEKVVDVVGKLADGFAGLSPTTQIIILGAIGLLAALGPLLIIIGSMATGIGAIAGLFAAGGALAAAGTVIGALITGILALAWPILLIVGAAFLLYETFTHWDDIKKILGDLKLEIEQFVYHAVKQIEKFVSGLDITQALSDMWKGINKFVSDSIDSIGNFFKVDFKGSGASMVDGLVAGIKSILDLQPLKLINETIDKIKTYLSTVTLYQLGVDILTTLFKGILISILGPFILIANAWADIKTFLKGVDLKKIASDIWATFIAGIKQYLLDPITQIKKTIEDTKTYLKNVDLKKIASDIWATFIAGIKQYLLDPITQIKKTIEDTKTYLKNVDLKKIASDIWATFIAGIKQYILDPITQIKKTVEDTKTYLKNTNLKQIGIDIINSFKNGIMDTLNGLYKDAKKVFDDIKSLAGMSSGSTSSGTGNKSGATANNQGSSGASKSVSSSISKSVSNLAAEAHSSGSSIMASISAGISSGASMVHEAASNALSWVSGLFPHSLAKEGPFSKLVNWDTVFVEPANASLQKMRGNVAGGLDNISRVINQNTTSQHNPVTNTYQGDSISIGPNNLTNGMDIKKIMDEIDKRATYQRRARGY